MFIYNVTANVSFHREEEWLQFMRESHIKDVLGTGRFHSFKFLKLINEDKEANGNTYAVQYFANTLKDIQLYLAEDATRLRDEVVNQFGNDVMAFRTVLEEI
jgi:hypothetical protein